MRKLTHWLEELSPAESLDFYRDSALYHAGRGGPIGAKIADLVCKDKLRDLCLFELPSFDDPAWGPEAVPEAITEEAPDRADTSLVEGSFPFYDDIFEGTPRHWDRTLIGYYTECRQALAYFSKLENLEIGIDKQAIALEKFLEAEVLNEETNSLLKQVRAGTASLRPKVSAALFAAKARIATVLGDVPSIGDLDLRFGPGATRGVKKNEASTRRKLSEALSCSTNLLPILPFVLGQVPHLAELHSKDSYTSLYEDYFDEMLSVDVQIVNSRLGFVPKNAKTDRTICTEPGLNVLVQAGYGSYIARRLGAFGVDIRDQTVNQRRALLGSLTGDLATLDLSSASDTISLEIVWELLPLDWALALDRARSTFVDIPTPAGVVTKRQAKFSSMGNGFTFPLETLIFWSLACACCPGGPADATVYGDDIVIPTDCYQDLIEVLTACGFKVNKEKSFCEGPFRESCGKDYIRGTDVRPIYPRGWVNGQTLFVLHNWYVRKGNSEMAMRIRNAIHPCLWVFGPDGFGDGHLIGEYQKQCPDRLRNLGYDGHFFDTYVCRVDSDKESSFSDCIVPHYTVYRRSSDAAYERPRPIIGSSESQASHLMMAQQELIFKEIPSYAPLPLAGEEVKSLPIPVVIGYKKIKVYTLGR